MLQLHAWPRFSSSLKMAERYLFCLRLCNGGAPRIFASPKWVPGVGAIFNLGWNYVHAVGIANLNRTESSRIVNVLLCKCVHFLVGDHFGSSNWYSERSSGYIEREWVDLICRLQSQFGLGTGLAWQMVRCQYHFACTSVYLVLTERFLTWYILLSMPRYFHLVCVFDSYVSFVTHETGYVMSVMSSLSHFHPIVSVM